MRYTQAKVHYKGLKKDYNETMEKVSLLVLGKRLGIEKVQKLQKRIQRRTTVKTKNLWVGNGYYPTG